MKHEVSDKENTIVSSLHFLSSTFIDLSDSSDEDVCLHVSFDVNVSSSFSGPKFECVPYARCAFKLELGLGLELQNCNRLFKNNVCCIAFIKRVEVIGLQQDQSPICFFYAHHIQR
jgi:hypothetical protein